jgi:hypothetical protein
MELDVGEGGWQEFFFWGTETLSPPSPIPVEIVSVHSCNKTLFLPTRNNKRYTEVNLKSTCLLVLGISTMLPAIP